MTSLTTMNIADTQNRHALTDWQLWEEHRASVRHPTLAIKAADIVRARKNIAHYAWAREYAQSVEQDVAEVLSMLTPAYLETMIPATTPGDLLFTPCPACRDQKKPRIDHGEWKWSAAESEHLVCKVCSTVFPHKKYPESIVLHTSWGTPQTLSFCGGEPFSIFGYKTGRPSFSGNIRAQKVDWMATLTRRLAEAYILSGKLEYARGARLILLRFSEVYPHWLIHSGYGEYADMDPKVAAPALNALPQDKLVYPPNTPGRSFYVGYWTAGRARGVGLEGNFVRRVAEAYDLTCEAMDETGRPLYTNSERRRIERDLLLESTLLALGDISLNNKSVSNNSATALVGMTVGHPGLVRFGYDLFLKTVSGWFLPDGTTSESPTYANMTLNGIADFAQALCGYSDPPGYKDSTGRRLEKLDPYHATPYQRVWEAAFDTLQGDLLYPPFADSFRDATLPARYVELIASRYPQRPQYMTLLKETAGAELSNGNATTAIYYRELELEKQSTPPLVLPDRTFPDLRLGFLREGENGRGGLLLLSASHWGIHHHRDSLNLYYWKNGAELLSDLGYLWDHPEKGKTSRTLAHNTVLIDEQEQVTRERGGELLFSKADLGIKVIRAASHAYPQASRYQRTVALVDHGVSGAYAVDFFEVEGGAIQDYVFHGPNHNLKSDDLKLAPHTAPLYDLQNVRAGAGTAGIWSLTWQVKPELEFTAWQLPQAGERAFIGDGWGQRDFRNTDIGTTLPYIVRRTTGDDAKVFTALFEGYSPGQALVRSLRRLSLGKNGAGESGAVAVMIETALGRDYIVVQRAPREITLDTPDGVLRASGALTIVSLQNGHVTSTFSENNTPVRFEKKVSAAS